MNRVPFRTVEDAVLCFYESNHTSQAAAHLWLTQLQESPQIWDIIWNDLLPSKHTEVQFYGATILHSKLLNNWSEIPASQYDRLKIRLLEAVLLFRDGLNVVLNRLCISLAVFLLRTAGWFWPDAITELISYFCSPSSILANFPTVNREKLTCLLLGILTAVPEEFQTIIKSANEKSFTEKALTKHGAAVFAFLEMALNNSTMDIQSRALQCSVSWLRNLQFSPENGDNFLDLLIRVVTSTYKNENAQQLSESAIDSISALCGNEERPEKVILYIEKLMAAFFEILVPSQGMPNDYDVIPYLCRMFIDIAEYNAEILIKTLLTDKRDVFLKLLHLMLLCCNASGHYPVDETLSIDTFNFLFLLQDTIIENECPEFANEEISNIVKSFYRELVVILLGKSIQPNDLSNWSSEDKESHRCYQQDIEDIYTYSYQVLNTEFLEIVSAHLEKALENADFSANWKRVDSCLRAFSAVSESAKNFDDPRILHCILTLEKLPLTNMNVEISQTVMELFASYAEWFCTHNELLEPVLSLIFVCTANPQLVSPATYALKDITMECSHVLSPFTERMVDQLEELLKEPYVGHDERKSVIFSLGVMMSSLSDGNTIMEHLHKVVGPYINEIDLLLSSPVESNPNKVEKDLTECVEILGQLFASLFFEFASLFAEPKVPVLCLFKEVLPRFQAILFRYRGKKCTRSICGAMEFAVSNLGVSCAAFLPSVIDLIWSTYSTSLYHPWLNLVAQLTTQLGNKSECVELISNLLRRICELTMTKLVYVPAGRENTEAYTSLYIHFNMFCTAILKTNRQLFLEIDGVNWSQMFVLAGRTLRVQEVETVRSSSCFLSDVIEASGHEKALLQIIQIFGSELVNDILMAIGKESPLICLEFVCNVLVLLSRMYESWLSHCLNQLLLSRTNFPSPHASEEAKKRFIKSVLENKADWGRVFRVTQEFFFLCRGLLNNRNYIRAESSTS